MANNNNKKNKNFKSRNTSWKNKSKQDDNYGVQDTRMSRSGNKPNGNPYKVEGGYKNSSTAGILAKTPNLGKGFGAASDVPAKLTFGKQSITFQPGFVNDIRFLNSWNGNSDFIPNVSYNSQVVENYPWAVADRTAGIMGIQLHDFFGANNNTEKSPLNLAAQLNKQFIDTSLGEQLSFSSSDLGVYLAGVASAWSAVYWIKRAINLSHNSQDRAAYRTRGLYLTMRICKEGHPANDPDPTFEIAGKSARYLERLNASIKKLNTVPVPVQMRWLVSYTEDCYSNIFQDEPGETAQLYVCNPAGFYLYNETATSTDPSHPYYNGASLEWFEYNAYASVHDGYVSIPEMLDTLETMLEALATHTNSDVMAQKVLNAHGTANTLQCPTFQTSDELVPIIYDEDFLSALENANIVPEQSLVDKDYTIDAAREMIEGRPKFKVDGTSLNLGAYSMINLPLQFHCEVDKIDAHAVSNALRWHPYAGFSRKHETSGTWDYHEVDFENNFGFQLITDLSVTYIRSNGQLYNFSIHFRSQLASYAAALQDFKTLPIAVKARMLSVNNSGINMTDVAYNARRDIEVSISGEDVANYFWSLAEMVWDVVDGQTSFSGQRNKMG